MTKKLHTETTEKTEMAMGGRDRESYDDSDNDVMGTTTLHPASSLSLWVKYGALSWTPELLRWTLVRNDMDVLTSESFSHIFS